MSDTKLLASKIFVTGVKVQAEIGVYRHEIGRVQPLIVDVELDAPTGASDRLADTFNYEAILQAAQEVAAGGHIHLVETFAHRLAEGGGEVGPLGGLGGLIRLRQLGAHDAGQRQ